MIPVFPHLYVYDKGNKAEERNYEFGKMAVEGKKLIKTNKETDSAQWSKTIEATIHQLKPEKNGLVIYIHGFQADNTYFMHQSGFVIQRHILDHPSHPYGMAISLQWKSVLMYESAVTQALKKGRNFAILLEAVYEILKAKYPEAPVSFICHSMGNRVFQGIFEQWITMRPGLALHHVMMFAADLESNIFNTYLKNLAAHCQTVYVYYHGSDKTLLLARAFKPHSRLGISGPEQAPLLPPNVIGRDVTGMMKENEAFAGKLTLHRYYYGSPGIRNEIVSILSH
ncbi:MAG: alpha/beta hydrolase [Saprospiraceae bacterium]|nr:alpha/beta hydrolase [Saprospiraceae bacterium]